MYKEHLKLQTTNNKNRVFTTVNIPARKPIMEITGPVILEKDLIDPNHPALLQVGPDIFIGASGDIDDNINHSCNPNCYIHIAGNRAILFSLYVISANSELTFDYSSTSTDSLEKWQMNCSCNNINCRKIISGFQNLSPHIQQKLKNQNTVPLYILHPTMFPITW